MHAAAQLRRRFGAPTRAPPAAGPCPPARQHYGPAQPYTLWEAASAGNLPAVRGHLATGRVLPHAIHPALRLTPLLLAAFTRTASAAHDVRLKETMRALRAAGDPLLAVEPFTSNTALHILAEQGRGRAVQHRLDYLVRSALRTCFNAVMIHAISECDCGNSG